MRTALAALCLIAVLITIAPASARMSPGERWKRVAYKTKEGSDRAFSRDEVRLTMRAAAGNILGRGSIGKALSVAACESGFNEHAVGPGGKYVGVMQHDRAAWRARVRTFSNDRGPLGVHPWASWHNARAQAIVSMRMVAAGGWSPWACA